MLQRWQWMNIRMMNVFKPISLLIPLWMRRISIPLMFLEYNFFILKYDFLHMCLLKAQHNPSIRIFNSTSTIGTELVSGYSKSTFDHHWSSLKSIPPQGELNRNRCTNHNTTIDSDKPLTQITIVDLYNIMPFFGVFVFI